MKNLIWVVLLAGTQALAQRGPPAEALAACSSLSEGATCSFTHDSKSLSGTCKKGPNGEAAACLPAGMGGPHGHRGPPPEAIAACSGQSEGAACSVTLHGNAMAGTCSKGPDGNGSVACKPAKPGN